MNLNTNYWLHMGMRLAFHGLAVVWIVQTGVSVQALGLFGLAYLVSILSITVGYHRYFSHRAFQTSRGLQFALGVLGCCQLQGGPLAWASVHRHHHRHSDAEHDLHSPRHGVFWAHMGWLMDRKTYDVAFRPIKDLDRFPELVWLDRYNFIPAALSLGGLWVLGEGWQWLIPASSLDGWMWLFWAGVIRIVVVWHVTWSVNSICHLWGRRTHDTTDTSTNNLLLGLLACGEGWHNNHHHDPSSARSGFGWHQPDISFWVITCFRRLRLIWDVRAPIRQR